MMDTSRSLSAALTEVTRESSGSALLRDGLPCVACGYNLLGLSEEGMCPECGTAISRSLRGDLLSAASLAWLRRVVRGQRIIAGAMLLAGVCVGLTIGLLVVFVFTVGARPGLPRIVEVVFTWLIGGSLLGILIAVCAGGVGAFFLTEQEGRDSASERIWSARLLARCGIVGAVIAAAAVLAIRSLGGLGLGWVTIDLAVVLLLIASMTIAAVATLRRLASLVRRVPDLPLAMRIDKELRFLRWGVPAGAAYFLMLPAFRPPGLIGVSVVNGLVACVGFVALIGLLISSLRLVGIMRESARRLRLCLAVAAQILRMSGDGSQNEPGPSVGAGAGLMRSHSHLSLSLPASRSPLSRGAPFPS